jgi:hypothetical protein
MTDSSVKIDFRLAELAGVPSIIFDSGKVRPATECEVLLYAYIAELHDRRLESSLPRKIATIKSEEAKAKPTTPPKKGRKRRRKQHEKTQKT